VQKVGLGILCVCVLSLVVFRFAVLGARQEYPIQDVVWVGTLASELDGCPYRKPKSTAIMIVDVEFRTDRRNFAASFRASSPVKVEIAHGRGAPRPRPSSSERADKSHQMQDEVHAGRSRVVPGGARARSAVKSKNRTAARGLGRVRSFR